MVDYFDVYHYLAQRAADSAKVAIDAAHEFAKLSTATYLELMASREVPPMSTQKPS
jgi:hypothetical protein